MVHVPSSNIRVTRFFERPPLGQHHFFGCEKKKNLTPKYPKYSLVEFPHRVGVNHWLWTTSYVFFGNQKPLTMESRPFSFKNLQWMNSIAKQSPPNYFWPHAHYSVDSCHGVSQGSI